MKRLLVGSCLGALSAFTVVVPQLASADSVYVALGDSITFGETDLAYAPSYGVRGYVADFAGTTLKSENGGAGPLIVNLAIDGETAASFMSGTGRTPPVVGRTDAVLAAENLNYAASPSTSQLANFSNVARSETAAGNTISTISITLGFNELAALATLPTNQALATLPSTLATYQSNYTRVLTDIRTLEPAATIYILGYYDPFPANPSNPAAPIFAQGGPELNSAIQTLATEFGAEYVDTSAPFVGHEATLTYLGQYPAGSAAPGSIYNGLEPIGNVHPNGAGYAVIASQVAAVPEPAATGLMGFTAVGTLLIFRRRLRSQEFGNCAQPICGR